MAEPQRDKYDVAVIGAGLAGITCGALLAREGMSVLVVEQRPSPGGVCHSYPRDGYTVDVGSHLLSGCNPGWVVHNILERLGTAGQVEFLPVDPLAQVVFPEHRLTIPPSYEAFAEELARHFPEEKARLLMMFREMQEVYREVDELPHTFGLWQYLKVPVNQPVFLKYPSKTYQDLMDEFLLDPRLKPIVASLWVYFGLPPSRISAIFWTVVIMSYFLGGGSYPRGGIGSLARALAAGLEGQGGELRTSTLVDRIVVERGAVKGIEVADVSDHWDSRGRLVPPQERGERRPSRFVAADTVVSAGDARHTFFNLVGDGNVDGRYLRKLARLEPSLCLIKVALGTDLDVRAAGLGYHDTVFYDTYDMDQVWAGMTSRIPEAPCDVTIPTVTDPSLAPEGKHCVYLWNYVPYDAVANWRGQERELVQRMIQGTERWLPGLSQRAEVLAVMTPQTMREYALTTEGSPYGWAFSPEQMGFNRLQPRTPIRNLYLTGHWTTPGAGVAGVAMSGERTASIVRAREGFTLWRKSA